MSCLLFNVQINFAQQVSQEQKRNKKKSSLAFYTELVSTRGHCVDKRRTYHTHTLITVMFKFSPCRVFSEYVTVKTRRLRYQAPCNFKCSNRSIVVCPLAAILMSSMLSTIQKLQQQSCSGRQENDHSTHPSI